MKNIIILTGHTASGKSKFVLDFEAKFQDKTIKIINIDCFQVYKDNKILSAQPFEIKNNYRLYSYLDSDQFSNLSNLIENVNNEIINSKEDFIFIVGGSPLYVRKLIDGLSSVPKIETEIINLIEEEYNQNKDSLYRYLLHINYEYKKFIKINDKKRIIRYLSVFKQTGKRIEEFEENKNLLLQNNLTKKFLLYLDRESLYKNAEKRIDFMLENGAVEEVVQFIDKYKDLDYKNFLIYKTIGFSEIEQFLENKIQKDEMIEKIKQKTRNYIKHQDTWYKNQFEDFKRIKNFQEFEDIILN